MTHEAVRPTGESRLLWHPAGAVAVRLLIGGVLLYAGLQKVGHVESLARIVYGYRVVPPELVNLVAMTLPWLEMLVGALLLLGLLRRSSAVGATGLFGVFAVAVGLAMAHGIDAPCGCFSVAAGSERIGWLTLLRVSVLALLSAYLVFHPSRFAEVDALLEQCPPPGTAPALPDVPGSAPERPASDL